MNVDVVYTKSVVRAEFFFRQSGYCFTLRPLMSSPDPDPTVIFFFGSFKQRETRQQPSPDDGNAKVVFDDGVEENNGHDSVADPPNRPSVPVPSTQSSVRCRTSTWSLPDHSHMKGISVADLLLPLLLLRWLSGVNCRGKAVETAVVVGCKCSRL